MLIDNDPLNFTKDITALKNHHLGNFACDPKSVHSGPSMMSRKDVEGSIASEGTFQVKYSLKDPSEAVKKLMVFPKGLSFEQH